MILSLLFILSQAQAGDDSTFTISYLGSQNLSGLNLVKSISVDFSAVPFYEVLDSISAITGINMNYNSDRIPVHQEITLRMEDSPLIEVLIQLMRKTGTRLIVSKESTLIIVPVKANESGHGKIEGNIFDRDTRLGLAGANISIVGSFIGTISDQAGNFIIEDIPAGLYLVEYRYMGYQTSKQIFSVPGDSTRIEVALASRPVRLKEVTVTPGVFSIMGDGPNASQALTRENLQNITFGEDIYRAVTRLPGISSNDFSAKFSIRGGDNDEILVLLDGLAINEPFHMKDLAGGVFSYIDVNMIESVDLLTGGFPAQYGNRMSGVLNINTVRPEPGQQHLSLGLGFMNAKFRSDGTFENNKGAWFISARRGYLDVMLDMLEADNSIPRPKYYDLHTKFEYQVDDKNRISYNLLHAGDDARYIDEDEGGGETSFRDTYGWINLRTEPTDRIFVRTVISLGKIFHDKNGMAIESDGTVNLDMIDRRTSNIAGLRQDWTFEYSRNVYLKSGIEIKQHVADYFYKRYSRQEIGVTPDSSYYLKDTINTNLALNGYSYGVYLSDRFKIGDPATLELGLRYDYFTYNSSHSLSPRINLLWEFENNTSLRIGWGHFYQNQQIHEIPVADGEQKFHQSEKAEHFIAGLEHKFDTGINLRLESYYKTITNQWADYRNGSGKIQFPELEDDRYRLNIDRSRARGIEAYLAYDYGGEFTWWASYALSKYEEDINSLVFRDSTYTKGFTTHPGKYDQRHTFYLDFNYRPNRKWIINAALQYHSGLPFIDLEKFLVIMSDGSVQLGESFSLYNRDNYDPYFRLDFRINRHFYMSTGVLTLYLQVINLVDYKNMRTIEFDDETDNTGQTVITEDKEYWFPRIPSFGINWEHIL